MLSDYVVNDIPTIQLVSQEELYHLCGFNCTAVYLNHTIFLNENLDPQSSMKDRGVLVHELTHHHQQMRGRWGLTSTCDVQYNREKEAYQIQNYWYSYNNVSFYVNPTYKKCY